MSADESARRRLLASLPDTPRWVETRGALLDGRGEVLGSAADCVVRVPDQRLLTVVGEPEPGAWRAALEGVGDGWALVCAVEDGERWAARLEGWTREKAVVCELAAAEPELPAPTVAATIEQVAAPSPELLEHLPERLRHEIAVVAGRRPLFAAWVDGRAVSFCYAAFSTETLWDVSVDTVGELRRAGLAGACAVAAIRHLAGRNLRPVWAAVESNLASRGLARKLGFWEMDRIEVFER